MMHINMSICMISVPIMPVALGAHSHQHLLAIMVKDMLQNPSLFEDININIIYQSENQWGFGNFETPIQLRTGTFDRPIVVWLVNQRC